MLRRSLLALSGGAVTGGALGLALPTGGARAEPGEAGRRWFIQVWFEGTFPIPIDPADDPGRVEVTIAGEFVACATASVYASRQRETFLVPLSIGASASGRREDIKVEVYGALKRWARPVVKVSEIGA